MNSDDVTVVLATYNEAETIEQLLDQMKDYRIVLVDDSSPDGTGEIARDYYNVEVVTRAGKLGIATAYLDGFRTAFARRSTYIVQMDAGLTHKPADVGRLVVQAQETNSDLVIGSRFLTKSVKGPRTFISLGAAFLMRRLGINVRDASSGFRCWRTDTLAGMDFVSVRARGFAFQLELLHRAWQAGGRITEMPIEYLLTNSSFNSGMLIEALRIYRGLWRDSQPRVVRDANLPAGDVAVPAGPLSPTEATEAGRLQVAGRS